MNASPSRARYHIVPRTLCFVFNGEDVLLIKRSPHKRLFPGKINGLGGHVEHDEDVETAVIREVREEANLELADVWLAGVVNVDVSQGHSDGEDTNGVPGVMIFVFTATATGRNVQASEEGELLWVPLTAVDNLDWVGDKPDLFYLAMEAMERKRPFYIRRENVG